MGATTRNVIVVMTALTSLLAAAAWLTLTKVQTHARADVAKSLTTALESSEHAIHLVFHNQETAAELWAGNSDVLRMTKTLLAQARTADALISAPAQQELRTWLKPAVRTIGYRGFFIIANDDVNIASTRDTNIGVESQLVGNGDFLARVRGGETLISLPQPSDVALVDVDGTLIVGLPTMFVAAPIRNDSQDVIAVLALRIEPDESFSPVFERGRFGDSGETYAFDASGLMISESRFNDQLHDMGLIPGKRHSDLSVELRDPGVDLRDRGRSAALPGERPLTRMAASATAGESGMDLDGYRDYRGVPVVGAWLWNSELGFGIATEVDVSEAFAQFRGTRLAVLAFTLVSVAVLFVLVIVLSFGRRALQDAEERNRMILESAGEGIYGLDLDGNTTFANAAAAKMVGWQAEELIGKQQHAILHHTRPDGTPYPREDCPIYAAMKDGKVHHSTDEVFWRKDGTSFPVEYTSTPVRSDGRSTGAVVVFRDITAQRETEQALLQSHENLEQRVQERTTDLQDSEARYRGVMENVADGLATIDEVGRVESFNPAAERMFGYTAEEVIGHNVTVLMPEPDHGQHDGYLRRYLRTGVGKIIGGGGREVTARRKDGSSFPMELMVSATFIGDNRVFVGVMRDITERKRMAAELIQSAKLATLGEMSTGLAHELNQPLNVIRMAADSSLERIEEGDVDTKFLHGKFERISAQVERAAEVIDHMRIFGRQADERPVNLDPREAVKGALGLMGEQLRMLGIEVETRFPERCPKVSGHAVQLEQVVLNLIGNARDAIEANRQGEGDTRKISLIVEEAGSENKVNLIVEDSGGGIPADLLGRIFEPFFTTKEAGKGTGLGLSISYGIVTEMGGTMKAANLDDGAGITITLPTADEDAAAC